MSNTVLIVTANLPGIPINCHRELTHANTLPQRFWLGRFGMINMGFLSAIRRWALRDKMPIREIARGTGLSRNTINK